MKSRTFQIGMVTVVLMVALRVTIGWHFFYEGVWKIAHPEFSAEGFLKNAKGPAAPLFYAMMPDIDGEKRLAIDRMPVADDLRAYWRKLRNDAEIRSERVLLKDGADVEEGREKLRQFRIDSHRLLWETEEKLAAALDESHEAIMRAFGPQEPSETDAADEPATESGDESGDESGGDADQETAAPPDEATLKAVQDLVVRLHEIEKPYLDQLAQFKAEAVGGNPPNYQPRVPADAAEKAPQSLIEDKTIVGVGNKTLVAVEREVVGPERTYVDRWETLLNRAVKKYQPTDEQRFEMQRLYHRYKNSVETVLEENEQDIASYFGSLQRHRAEVAEGNNPPFQRKRNWDRMQELRGEAGQWTGELDTMESDLATAMWNVLDEPRRERGDMPASWTMTDLINTAVTWGLTLIGLCLMIGLATRPAALGGGVFLIFVLLTQPPWPTIYPPAPEVVGHALIVDKNFVEMVAVFLLAASPVGRWAGLDYFLENFILRRCPVCKSFCKKTDEKKS